MNTKLDEIESGWDPASSNVASSQSPIGAENCGLAIFDTDLRLVSWSTTYFDIQELPKGLAEPSRPFEDFIRFWLARQRLPLGEAERRAIAIIDDVKSAQPHRNSWTRLDGRQVTTLVAPIYGGGIVSMCTMEYLTSASRDHDSVCDEFLSRHSASCTRVDVLDALDRMVDGFAMYDNDDRLVFCNERYQGFAGTSAPHVLPGTKYAVILKQGFDLGDYVAEDETAESIYKLHKRARTGDTQSYEFGLRDGRWLSCSDTRTQDGNTICIQSDVTERKQRESELTRLSDALSVQNLHFDTALNNMAQGLCLFDPEQRLIVCNRRYLDMYGFSPDVVKPGILLREIMEYSVSLGNYSQEDARDALDNRPIHAEKKEQSVLEQHLRDGRVIAVLHQPMPGGGSVATYEDVTERKQAEKRLEQHAEALEARNQELQRFAYVASHDLQEPLRKIEAFGGRLRKKCESELGKDGKMYLERMEDAARRMRLLIEDLLAYSRLSTGKEPYGECNLNAVMQNVVSDLEIRLGETGAVLELCELPTIHASEVQMHQLFLNLISNALKFIREGVQPKITLTVNTITVPDSNFLGSVNQFCEITIRDNGIGFEQKYAEQIFGIFQRLHGRTTFEGTGIGLATCRRIAEQHGGTIEAFGEPDVGAAFKITLLVRNIPYDEATA